MGFLEELFGVARARDELPRGVTVRHLRTAYKKRLLEHFAAAFPGRKTVVWDDPDTLIELAVMFPTAAEPYYVVHTIGMSAEPMNLDDMPKKRQYEWLRWAELMLFLPGDWPVDESRWPQHLNDPEDKPAAWPLRLLRLLAALPRKGNTWLGAGHSIPNGAPPHPYAENAPFTGAVLFLPGEKNGPRAVESVKIGGGKRLMLYLVVPVYPQEMAYKLEKGAEALEEKLRGVENGFVADIRRPPAVEQEEEGTE